MSLPRQTIYCVCFKRCRLVLSISLGLHSLNYQVKPPLTCDFFQVVMSLLSRSGQMLSNCYIIASRRQSSFHIFPFTQESKFVNRHEKCPLMTRSPLSKS